MTRGIRIRPGPSECDTGPQNMTRGYILLLRPIYSKHSIC